MCTKKKGEQGNRGTGKARAEVQGPLSGFTCTPGSPFALFPCYPVILSSIGYCRLPIALFQFAGWLYSLSSRGDSSHEVQPF